MEKITMTVSELSKMLGISTATVYTMVREDEIPHFRIRERIMFNREIMEAWTRGEYVHESEQAIG